MSHSSAQLRFDDGSELHGEYDGTSDVMLPRMFRTPEERNEQWRKQEWPKAECHHDKEGCIVHSDYGGGFTWPGETCRTCLIFTGPHDPWEHAGLITSDSQTAA